MPRRAGFSRTLEREWLPFEPLSRFQPEPFAERSATGSAWHGGLGGNNRLARAWHRAKKDGRITVSMADELCIHLLHLHPAEVYGDLWWKEDE